MVVLLLPVQWEARFCHLQILMCDLQMTLQKRTDALHASLKSMGALPLPSIRLLI